MKADSTPGKHPGIHRLVQMAALTILLGVLVVGLTTHYLDADKKYTAIEIQRSHIVAAEVAFFLVITIELLGTALVRRVQDSQARHVGIGARAVLRVVGYIILAITVVSILAADASLAISVGTVMGIIIGFSTQSIIGNAIAGMVLAVGRYVRVGEQITVMGSSGQVVEIGSLYTMIESDSDMVLVPNTAMLANPIRTKRGQS